MLSACQRGLFIVVPAGRDLMRPAVLEAARVAAVVLALVCALAFGPELAGRIPLLTASQDCDATAGRCATAPRVPAAARFAEGERLLAAWGHGTGKGSRAAAQEQRNVARFLSERYRVAADEVAEVVSHAYRTARETGLEPTLLLAVMSVESSLDASARSPAGAHGLMQVLTRVHVERFEPFGGPAAAFEPLPNIRVGAAILKEYLLREGSIEGALKSYVGAALRSHDGGYGAKVLAEQALILEAARGRPA